jgi:hypothetical protein
MDVMGFGRTRLKRTNGIFINIKTFASRRDTVSALRVNLLKSTTDGPSGNMTGISSGGLVSARLKF